MRAPLLIALVASAVAACGEDGPEGNPGGQVYRLEWGPVEVPPFTEDTRCVTMRLGNDIPVKIHEISNELGATSHHFIVYRLAAGEENTTPEPCTPFIDTLDPTAGAPLMVTQKQSETLTLPDGVAFSLMPDQMVRLEMHYINPTSEPVMATATSELHAMADADFVHEADFLFIGNPDIRLAANPQVQSLETYFPLPPSLEGANVFAITGHQHKLGVGVTVDLAEGPSDPGRSVYAPADFDWEEPETVFHDPPFQIPAASGFHFVCEWVNDSGQWVGFGESANDEMCFFWAYYYPSQGSKVCVHTEIYTENPYDICCPDSEIECALVNAYLESL